MESDEPLGEQISQVPDKVWRVWAVSLGMALILGRLLYIQEQHTVELAVFSSESQATKTELESLKTQTQTYQQGARDQFADIRQRLSRLEN